MAIIDTLKMYETLKVEMPDRSAKAVAKALELSFEEYRVNQGELLVTKQEMTEFRAVTHKDIADLRTETANSRAEMIKWMFIFWIGQISVLAGLYIALR